MAQGTVKWFSSEKGYGFITPDGGGEDVFVHYSGISGGGFRNLEEGAKVSYEAAHGKKGMQAVNVTPATEVCSSCGGSGTCRFCDGKGLEPLRWHRLGCQECYGWIKSDKTGNGMCGYCKGRGRVRI